MRKRGRGRCPECGEVVMVELTKGKPGRVMPHECRSRACEYPVCRVKGLMEEMVRVASGEWYCPGHGLLVAAKELVSLYRVKGDGNWTAMCEIIVETLPDLIIKAEVCEGRTARGEMR